MHSPVVGCKKIGGYRLLNRHLSGPATVVDQVRKLHLIIADGTRKLVNIVSLSEPPGDAHGLTPNGDPCDRSAHTCGLL